MPTNNKTKHLSKVIQINKGSFLSSFLTFQKGNTLRQRRLRAHEISQIVQTRQYIYLTII